VAQIRRTREYASRRGIGARYSGEVEAEVVRRYIGARIVASAHTRDIGLLAWVKTRRARVCLLWVRDERRRGGRWA
jgi:hypothetical protein